MEPKDTGRGSFAVLLAPLTALILAGSPRADEPALEHDRLGVLDVTVTGLESTAGRVAIALFASSDDYETQSNAVRRAWLDIENGESRWVVEALPEGEYALIAYQDINGNEQIDMRILGMPKEPVGVSNDARGLFGPPRFKAAKFRFTAPLTHHRFTLR